MPGARLALASTRRRAQPPRAARSEGAPVLGGRGGLPCPIRRRYRLRHSAHAGSDSRAARVDARLLNGRGPAAARGGEERPEVGRPLREGGGASRCCDLEEARAERDPDRRIKAARPSEGPAEAVACGRSSRAWEGTVAGRWDARGVELPLDEAQGALDEAASPCGGAPLAGAELWGALSSARRKRSQGGRHHFSMATIDQSD
eukprot:1194060-Prorocentrum_minimum.AAC.2